MIRGFGDFDGTVEYFCGDIELFGNGKMAEMVSALGIGFTVVTALYCDEKLIGCYVIGPGIQVRHRETAEQTVAAIFESHLGGNTSVVYSSRQQRSPLTTEPCTRTYYSETAQYREITLATNGQNVFIEEIEIVSSTAGSPTLVMKVHEQCPNVRTVRNVRFNELNTTELFFADIYDNPYLQTDGTISDAHRLRVIIESAMKRKGPFAQIVTNEPYFSPHKRQRIEPEKIEIIDDDFPEEMMYPVVPLNAVGDLALRKFWENTPTPIDTPRTSVTVHPPRVNRHHTIKYGYDSDWQVCDVSCMSEGETIVVRLISEARGVGESNIDILHLFGEIVSVLAIMWPLSPSIHHITVLAPRLEYAQKQYRGILAVQHNVHSEFHGVHMVHPLYVLSTGRWNLHYSPSQFCMLMDIWRENRNISRVFLKIDSEPGAVPAYLKWKYPLLITSKIPNIIIREIEEMTSTDIGRYLHLLGANTFESIANLFEKKTIFEQ